MRCNLEWLRQWVAIAPDDARALGERLTLAGLEVDAEYPAASELSRIVAARIVEAAAHPDAGRLRLCRVDAGGRGSFQVVCGAPNARVGLCAPLALAGARVAGKTVAAATIRGVESQGMLCSAAELGLGDDAGGLLDLGDLEPGVELGERLGSGDVIYDLDLTPNRADCFSVFGVAREIAALGGVELRAPEQPAVAAAHDLQHAVAVAAEAACPRYLSRVVTGLDPRAVAPLWMRERLRRCGMRSVHPVVDVLNYVMLECGQPMHAYDSRRLAGDLQVRLAKDGERLHPIGGGDGDAALALNGETLVIGDDGGALAVAGIIGGAKSAVREDTRDVVLECAFFAPETIAGRARALGLHTESSRRFERGVDPRLQTPAMERATRLLLDIVGGGAGPVLEVRSERHLPRAAAITLRAEALAARLGVAVAADFVVRALACLGCRVDDLDDGAGWRCVPPSWRFDLHVEEDLIEEIARMYGYHKIPERLRAGGGNVFAGDNRARERDRRFDDCLVEAGYCEVVTYSFISPREAAQFSDERAPRLKNPLSSEMSVMRASLWPGLLRVLSYNLDRQRERVRIFERGPVFFESHGRPGQSQVLAGLACGALLPEQWGDDGRACDFHDVKGDLEQLLRGYGDVLRFEAAERPGLHPGRCALVALDDVAVGHVGQLSPSLEQRLEFPAPVLLFALELEHLPARPPPSCRPLSPYPAVRRDVAVVFPEEVTAASVVRCIEDLRIEQLVKIVVFDVFAGGDIQSAFKSITLGLIFQDLFGTLESGSSDAWVETVVETLERELSGKLRTTD